MEMKPIPGWEGLYSATDDGQIYSERSKKFLKLGLNKNGYQQVNLSKDGNYRRYYVHRLIAMTFLENPNNLPQINHISENKTDNSVSNLEWISAKENVNFGTRNERSSTTQGRTIYCLELEKTFPSINTAAREINISHGSLSAKLKRNNGKCVYTGLHFEYVNK